MYRFAAIAGYNLRFNLLPHLLVGIGILLLTPILFGVTALDAEMLAYPMELALPWIGVALLTPIFTSEPTRGVADVIAARRTSYPLLCVLRVALAAAILAVLVAGFSGFMNLRESQVPLGTAAAAYANAVFLGGLGMLAASLGGGVVIGYMAPVLYFVLDLMGGAVPFTLFSMMRFGAAQGKWTLALVGAACIAASIPIRRFVMRHS